MISYLVQVAIGGVMKYEYPFDTYGEAFRRFRGLSRGTGQRRRMCGSSSTMMRHMRNSSWRTRR